MLIKQVDIDEYGQLKHKSYSFADDRLTVVYGLNEAGKSTLFHFIETMLFGFSRKKLEVEHYKPDNISQYGGSCIIELEPLTAIKITRYYKQHKGQPVVTKLSYSDSQFQVLEEQLISQDELERLYISPLNRTIYRDLCALTLDELQATSMKEDEQLNQHLYHATWESSKIITQLEKKSNDALALMYRPRGSKQQINIILNELKQARDKRLAMENEIEAYQAIQTRLADIVQEEQQLALRKSELEAIKHVLSKAEQDFAVRLEWESLAFEYEQLRLSSINDEQLLSDISIFMAQLEQQQTYIDELNIKKQKLLLDYEVCQASFNSELYLKQKQLIEQLNYMEPLIEDIEAKQEQLKKQALFVKQICTVGSHTLDKSKVLEQEWTKDELQQLINMEETEKQAKQKQLLLEHQLNETKQKLVYEEEQHKWLSDNVIQLHARQSEQPFTFIPQQLDDVIRLETSYEECYKRAIQAKSSASDSSANRSSSTNQHKKSSTLPLALTILLSFVIAAALLMAQFSVVNIVLSVIVIAASVINAYLALIKRRQLVKLSSSSDLYRYGLYHSEKQLYEVLSQLIVQATPHISLEWLETETNHYQFRQALLTYKQYLKEAETQATAIKAVETRKFELSHLLRKQTQELEQIVEQLKTLYDDWKVNLLSKSLPTSLSFSEVKQFVLDLETIKDNIVTLQAMTERLERDVQRRDEFYIQVNECAQALHITISEKHHIMIEAIKLKYEQDDKQAKSLQEISVRIEHIEAQLSDLQQPLQVMEASIRENFTLAQEHSIEKWKMWLATSNKMKQLSTAMFQLEQKRKAILSDAQLAILEARYKQQSIEQILLEAALLEEEYQDFKRQEISLLEERGQLQERLNNLSSTSERQQLDQQLLIQEERLAEALQQYTKLALMEFLVSTTRQQFEAEHQPALLQQASNYISKLTAGKYVKIVLQPESQTFMLATAQLSLVPVSRLSRGTAELVYFSLRIALLTTHQSLQHAPLILDDPFVNFDEARKKLVLKFIHQLGLDRQIVLLTCHSHMLEASQQHGQTHIIQL